MGRMLAERLVTESQDDQVRYDRLFLRLASRKPTAEERSACEDLIANARARYRDDLESATGLLSVGDARNGEAIPADELAAWTQLSMVILASDTSILLY